MKNEIKEITAILESKGQEAKRHVFKFTDPDGGKYPLTVAAFEPNIPDLKIGETYTFDCEFKPMPKDPSKFYKNFVRTTKDGPYRIQTTDGILPAPTGIPAPKIGCTSTPNYARPTTTQNPQKDYWDNREKKDSLSEFAKRRGGYSHDAATIIGALLQNSKVEVKNIETAAKSAALAVIQLTEYFVEEAEKAEAEFKKKQEPGTKPSS